MVVKANGSGLIDVTPTAFDVQEHRRAELVAQRQPDRLLEQRRRELRPLHARSRQRGGKQADETPGLRCRTSIPPGLRTARAIVFSRSGESLRAPRPACSSSGSIRPPPGPPDADHQGSTVTSIRSTRRTAAGSRSRATAHGNDDVYFLDRASFAVTEDDVDEGPGRPADLRARRQRVRLRERPQRGDGDLGAEPPDRHARSATRRSRSPPTGRASRIQAGGRRRHSRLAPRGDEQVCHRCRPSRSHRRRRRAAGARHEPAILRRDRRLTRFVVSQARG